MKRTRLLLIAMVAVLAVSALAALLRHGGKAADAPTPTQAESETYGFCTDTCSVQ